MARPRKENMDYFPHDTDASGDEKIDAMRAMFGNDGYAFYFILCERIYRTSAAELDISKPVLLVPLFKKLLVTQEKFDEMIDASFELELFSQSDYSERGVLTSKGIKKRHEEVQKLRDKYRKKKDKPTSEQVFTRENTGDNSEKTGEETPERKVNKTKVNKTKVNKTEIPPQFEEFWDVYPKKVSRQDAIKAWKNKIVKVGIEPNDIIQSAKNYKTYVETKGTEAQYILYPSTFINGDRWKDYSDISSIPQTNVKQFQPRRQGTSGKVITPGITDRSGKSLSEDEMDAIIRKAERWEEKRPSI